MWLFYDFNFERNYEVLKSKSLCILLKKKYELKTLIKTKRNGKWKMENPTNSSRETNYVLQLI